MAGGERFGVLHAAPINSPQGCLVCYKALLQNKRPQANKTARAVFLPHQISPHILYNKKATRQKSNCFFWLGWRDLNSRMTESESVALPLGDTPILFLITVYYKSNNTTRPELLIPEI